MNTRFVLPASLALAFHGALFFAFSDSTRPITAIAAPVEPEPPRYVPVVYEPEKIEIVPVARRGESLPNPPEAPRPRGAEPVAFDHTMRMPIDVPPIRATTRGDARVIVPSDFRPGDGGVGDGWAGALITGAVLDNPPRARSQAAPIYPFEEKKHGITGEVVVEFAVDVRGVVQNARVIESSSRAFEEPTLRAVAKWRFEPGKRHGKVVGFRMTVPVVFNLNE
ncbi:MAG: TonB family protein [Candidatus Didemnitutus sp.]|nr:TonB family protein [Candidatus Didemnitutus sp.]